MDAGLITSIRPIPVDGGFRTWVFVEVRTSTGLTGLGEATLEFHEGPVIAAVDELCARLVGQPADSINHVWQLAYRGAFWRPGPVMMSALSGVEQALWDVAGQALDVPVHRLLGGPLRRELLVYANGPRGETPEQYARSARRLLGLGFTAMKVTPVPNLPLVGAARQLTSAVDAVAAIRAEVGPDVSLAVDVHGRLSPSMAIRLAELLGPYDIWFLEEPIAPDNISSIGRVVSSTSIPIAAGERVTSRRRFSELLDAGVAIVQPDLSHCGGIRAAQYIAARAEEYQAGFAPHNPLSPVNTLASAHLAFTCANTVALEWVVDDVRWRDQLLASPVHITDGRLSLPLAAGLGTALDPETVAAHPAGRIPPPDNFHDDGSVADW